MARNNQINESLLQILACPRCKAKVELAGDSNTIDCTDKQCGLQFPIIDGIPVMLIDEAAKSSNS